MAKIYNSALDTEFENDSDRVEAYNYLLNAVENLKSRALLFRAGIDFVDTKEFKEFEIERKKYMGKRLKLVKKLDESELKLSNEKILDYKDFKKNEKMLKGLRGLFRTKLKKLREKHELKSKSVRQKCFEDFDSLKFIYVRCKKSGLEELELTLPEILEKGRSKELVPWLEKKLGLGKKWNSK